MVSDARRLVRRAVTLDPTIRAAPTPMLDELRATQVVTNATTLPVPVVSDARRLVRRAVTLDPTIRAAPTPMLDELRATQIVTNATIVPVPVPVASDARRLVRRVVMMRTVTVDPAFPRAPFVLVRATQDVGGLDALIVGRAN